MTANNDTPPGDKDPAAPTEEQFDDTGAAVTTFGTEAVAADVEVAAYAPDTAIRVQAEWLDDEPGGVHCYVNADGAEVYLSLDPAAADRLAAKLTAAANYAREGGR
jgi:hypothetical protein